MFNENSAIVKIYAELVQSNIKTLEEIPESFGLRVAVETLLQKLAT